MTDVIDNRDGQSRYPEALLIVAALANIAVLLTTRYFPLSDATNHLARYILIARSWSGHAPPGVGFSWIPTGYIALDVVGAELSRAFSPLATLRILALAAVLLPSIGLYALLRAVAPTQRGWALVGLLLAFNWCVYVGFLSYAIGIGFALLWLAAWWPRRTDPRRAVRVAFAASTLLLYLVHLAAIAIILVVLTINLTDVMRRSAREGRIRDSVDLRRSVELLFLIIGGVAALWLVMKTSAPTFNGAVGTLEFRSVRDKLTHLLAPFFVFSATQCAVVVLALGASIAAAIVTARPAWRTDTWVLSAIALIGAYFVFPVTFLGAYDADIRFVIPAFLLVFCAIPRSLKAPSRKVLLIPFFGCLAHAIVIKQNERAIDRELGDYREALRQIPAEATVLPLVADRERHGRADPYRHFVHWRAIDDNQVTPGLFLSRSSSPYLAHFRAPSPYNPDERWGTREFEPLDWNRIRRDYQYIAQLGSDDRASTRIRVGASEWRRFGDVVIYRVAAPTAGGASLAGLSASDSEDAGNRTPPGKTTSRR